VTARAFVDTNVWVYAVDTGEPVKRARALDILAAGTEKDYVISVQVLGEFYATVTGKLKDKVSAPDGRAMVEQLKQLPVMALDITLVDDAISGCREWKISYWDALIIAAAQAAGCQLVISEDLSDGAKYGSVRVENPFRELTGPDESPG
jgi:predicted nucleic acid-binding protein